MTAADRLEDGFPHGTADGFDQGCRGGACPAAAEYGLSCKRAKQLSASDYQYQKLARRGLGPAEIALELGLIPEGPTTPIAPPPARAPKPPKPAPENPSTAAPAPPAPPTTTRQRAAHGTPSGYSAGCRDNCPGDPDTGLTCRKAASNQSAEYKRKKRAAAKAESAEALADTPTPTPTDTPTGLAPADVTAADLDAWAQDHPTHTFTEHLDELRERIDMPTPDPTEHPDWAAVTTSNEVEAAHKAAATATALAELHQQLTERARTTATRYADALAQTEERHERHLALLLTRWDTARRQADSAHTRATAWRRLAFQYARTRVELTEQLTAALAEVDRLRAELAAGPRRPWWRVAPRTAHNRKEQSTGREQSNG